MGNLTYIIVSVDFYSNIVERFKDMKKEYVISVFLGIVYILYIYIYIYIYICICIYIYSNRYFSSYFKIRSCTMMISDDI